MTNTPWEAASPRYKKLVFTAMAIMGIGIILAIIGANIPSLPTVYTAIGIMLVGMLCHIAGMMVRAKDARQWRIENGLAAPRASKRSADDAQ
ncbi:MULTISPECIES: hypothetical protein [Glutamicibacter]|uniref:DUF2933 domain-containing protein n=1 Tax=Glutamicibacter halophytocola TaxID=1933880 RepID=A0A5B8IVK6_9MICC|nr:MULTISPECIES: hypothetical protein [Glutamicibacter]ALG29691.1 hypothetical protein AOZ07_12320 [Glutamicibacter halophytocola]MBF6673259.1 hypothetical protein [Glutamicibacter sp. FBE19]NQD39916.1 hypothetical protein [Glutamicibacter halophytocola]QDY65940.1 hypothetical protein FQA45_06230 [Glutamicibacter halophytocola]UUX58040.1 hypothetical protein NUH22_12050 [Glutamicibacter halophytocola]